MTSPFYERKCSEEKNALKFECCVMENVTTDTCTSDKLFAS